MFPLIFKYRIFYIYIIGRMFNIICKLIQHHVIKFVSDLRQVGGFLRVLQFPPPIKLTAMM